MGNFAYRPFESLRELRDRLSEKPLTEKLPPSEDDDELFERAMANVREIREFREIPYRCPRISVKRHPSKEDKSALERLEEIARGRRPIDITKTQEYVEWVNPRYRKELLRHLHEGCFSVQDFLDLHGYTRQEALEILRDFLRQARQRGLGCVKIIHGRGLRSVRGPVLKEAVCRWLERDFRKHIVAYATAQPRDGGLGAVYVLLLRD